MSSQDALDIDQTGLLSDATLSALQINQQPFAEQQRESAADAALFADEITSEQLADIKQALITGDDLLLIMGEQGAGKTTLLKQLGMNSGLRIQCFAVKGSSRFSTMNLFAGMLEAFKRKPPETLKQILDELIPCLQTMVSRNTLSAIVLDDAHHVNETELTQLLSGMLYVNSQDETLMRVALAAPSEFEDRIPDLLPEGADLPYSSLTIDGLSPNRAAAYIGFKLEQAGFSGEFPFTDRDLAALVDESAGLPASLHTATANELNRRHGLIEDSLPAELQQEPADSLLHSRFGKIALGSLATLLIVAGLAMFLNPDSDPDDNRYRVANQDSQPGDDADKTLRLLENEPVEVKPRAVTEVTIGDETASKSGDIAIADSQPVEQQSSPATDAQSGDAQPTISFSTVSTDDATAAVEPIAEAANGLSNDSTGDSSDQPADESSDNSEADSQNDNSADNSSSESVAATQDAPVDSEQQDDSLASDEQDAVSASTTTANADAEATNELIAAVTAPAEPDSAQQSAQNEETAEADDATKAPGYLESPNWILVQRPDQFTVQMSASRDRPSVENFLKRNPLDPPNSIYSFERDGDTWFALVHGLFPTIDDARRAVERMPASALTNQPWIRSVGRVQGVLKEQ